jgi:hypothetical protein
MTDYTRTPPQDQMTRNGAIVAVDAVNQLAAFVAAGQNTIIVNTGYLVGAVGVTPAVGEQWQIEKIQGNWRLKGQLPFNSPNDSAVVPTAGQHVLGSGNGPVVVQATQAVINAPLSTQAVPTAARPDPTSVPAGTQIYDSTLGKPIWSNGSNWHDSTGESV